MNIACKASPSRVGVAAVSQPSELQPPEWGVRGFDYSAIVQPVLDQYCAGCHNPIDPPQRVDLTGGKTDFFNVSYECLARENQGGRGSPVRQLDSHLQWPGMEHPGDQPKTWGSPRSRLAELVMNGHPDKTRKPRYDMDDRSRRRIFAWIDLNVPYYGSSETAYPELDRLPSNRARSSGKGPGRGEYPAVRRMPPVGKTPATGVDSHHRARMQPVSNGSAGQVCGRRREVRKTGIPEQVRPGLPGDPEDVPAG